MIDYTLPFYFIDKLPDTLLFPTRGVVQFSYGQHQKIRNIKRPLTFYSSINFRHKMYTKHFLQVASKPVL